MLIKDSAPGVAGLFAARWWAPILRGISVIAFGVLAFACPGVTVSALVLTLVFFAFMDGVFSLLTAIARTVGCGRLRAVLGWARSGTYSRGARLLVGRWAAVTGDRDRT